MIVGLTIGVSVGILVTSFAWIIVVDRRIQEHRKMIAGVNAMYEREKRNNAIRNAYTFSMHETRHAIDLPPRC